MTRTCIRCGFVGEPDLFRKGRNVCLPCQSSYSKNWYSKNWHSVKETEKKKRVNSYGISVEEYDRAVVEQGNKCKICSTSFATVLPRIDHCHKTGIVRGLLCNQCNAGLGMFRDNLSNLEKAIGYLRDEDKYIGNNAAEAIRRIL